MNLRKHAPYYLALTVSLFHTSASMSAQGEMGTGHPTFGSYAPVGGAPANTRVWSLANATIEMPAGCSSLVLSTSTMTSEGYKIAVATLLTAKATGKKVRFFAHAPRDDGCGVDYVQIID
jgi:hypothetical protein